MNEHFVRKAKEIVGGCLCSFDKGFAWDGVHLGNCIIDRIASALEEVAKEAEKQENLPSYAKNAIELEGKLCFLLSDFAGETGESEGAVDVLKRKLAELSHLQSALKEKEAELKQLHIDMQRSQEKKNRVIEEKEAEVEKWRGAFDSSEALRKDSVLHGEHLSERISQLEKELEESREHEKQTHEILGSILGTDTSLEDGARRMQAALNLAQRVVRGIREWAVSVKEANIRYVSIGAKTILMEIDKALSSDSIKREAERIKRIEEQGLSVEDREILMERIKKLEESTKCPECGSDDIVCGKAWKEEREKLLDQISAGKACVEAAKKVTSHIFGDVTMDKGSVRVGISVGNSLQKDVFALDDALTLAKSTGLDGEKV